MIHQLRGEIEGHRRHWRDGDFLYVATDAKRGPPGPAIQPYHYRGKRMGWARHSEGGIISHVRGELPEGFELGKRYSKELSASG